MKRKIVQVGNSLAVTLPRELVKEFHLKAGMEVQTSINHRNAHFIVEPGIKYFEEGKATSRFEKLADRLIKKRQKLLKRLA